MNNEMEDWCGGSWLEQWLIDTIGELIDQHHKTRKTKCEVENIEPLGDFELAVLDGVVFTLGNGRRFKAILEEVVEDEEEGGV